MILEKAINNATWILRKNNINTAQLDSEILMSSIMEKSRKFVLLNPNYHLEDRKFKNFKKLIRSRSLGKPIAYLTGKKDFWKHEFKINNDVLVPRPDTELIIEEVLKLFKNKNKLQILDIGVGSGCILLSILSEKKKFKGVGIDISKKSLELCKINALDLGLNKRVKFFKSDVDNFDYGKYDLIVSNPPYISRLKLRYLDRDVINFEPKIALNGGIDGLSEIRKVINKSSELIKKNGKFFLEVGCDQKNKVKNILKNKGFFVNKVIKDLANNDRCIISTKI
jgi:release factor glutamine methyltransferase